LNAKLTNADSYQITACHFLDIVTQI